MENQQTQPVISRPDMAVVENYKYKIYKPTRIVVLGDPNDPVTKRMEQFCDLLQGHLPSLDVKNETSEEDERPAIFIYPNIRFSAVPEGKLLELFLMCAAGMVPMEEAEAGVSAADIQNRIQMPGVVRVYVSPVCPHCPGALGRWLYMAAWAPDRVDLHVIDAAVFSESAARDNVKSVPTAILDDQFRWTGVVAVAELLDIFEKRNPADLSADTVKKIISDGDAEGLAALMAGANSVIPGFLDLLAHPKWPTRLGAMVAFEYLAETAPDLARQALEAMWNRFTALDDAVKGDMIHLFGVLNDSEFAGGRLESVINGDYSQAVREIAEEVLGDLA
jgi:hypothetical protein